MLLRAKDEMERVAGVVGGATGGGLGSTTGDETTMGFSFLGRVSTGLMIDTTGFLLPWLVATSDGEMRGFAGAPHRECFCSVSEIMSSAGLVFENK